MSDITIETEHRALVKHLVKNPAEIMQTLGVDTIDLIHAAMGIAGEAGELLDAVKKHAIYNKPLDIPNVIEELGDLEFYMEQLRQRLHIHRDMTLSENTAKLRRRYATGYSDEAAQQRADKVS